MTESRRWRGSPAFRAVCLYACRPFFRKKSRISRGGASGESENVAEYKTKCTGISSGALSIECLSNRVRVLSRCGAMRSGERIFLPKSSWTEPRSRRARWCGSFSDVERRNAGWFLHSIAIYVRIRAAFASDWATGHRFLGLFCSGSV